MKKNHLILALSISAFTSVLCAQGDKPPGGPRGGKDDPEGKRPHPPLIAALDLNKDGTIDADEISKASESLKKLDKNHDGKLTEEEFRPKPPGGPGGPGGDKGGPGGKGGPAPGGKDGKGDGKGGGGKGAPGGPAKGGPDGGPGGPDGKRPMPPLIAALDINKDGIIDADEISKASESLKTLDKNGDGKLTEDELHPPRPGGPGGPGGPGAPGGKPGGGNAKP